MLLPEQPYDDERIPLLDLRDKIRHDWNLPSLGAEIPAYLEPPPKPAKKEVDYRGPMTALTFGSIIVTWIFVSPPVGVGLGIIYGFGALIRLRKSR